jgi:hypothetical protein
MSAAIDHGLRLDRGLTQILQGPSAQPSALPGQQQLDPAESLARQQLDELLAPRGLAARLEAALVPQVADRSLLLPGAFRAALEQARAALQQAASRRSAPQDQRALRLAARVLDEDLSLRDLAAMYRNVLHQG